MFIDGRVALVHTSCLKDYFSLYLSSQRAKTITQKVYPSDYESRNLAAVETERGFPFAYLMIKNWLDENSI